MYRHTTPVPLKYVINDLDPIESVPLINLEQEAETVWGDYPGQRSGAGRYTDIYKGDVPVGRLWESSTATGLLHVSLDGVDDDHTSELEHWNAAMMIRLAFHLGMPAGQAFNYVLNSYEHAPVVETGSLENINDPAVDALYYRDRYDPEDDYIWCKEMQ
jgi:hypothetical protein